MNEGLILLSSHPHLGLKFWGLDLADKVCPLKKSLPLPGPLPSPLQHRFQKSETLNNQDSLGVGLQILDF